MAITEHLAEFFGKPVKLFKPGEPFDFVNFASRVAERQLHGDERWGKPGIEQRVWAEAFAEFLDAPGVRETPHLVTGSAPYAHSLEKDRDYETGTPYRPLWEAPEALPRLEALFLGDVVGYESHIEFLGSNDPPEALRAFPNLRAFAARIGGDNRVPMDWQGVPPLSRLESLTFQSLNCYGEMREVFQLEAPNLTCLELWSCRFSDERMAPLWAEPPHFPKLKTLALRNLEQADEGVRLLVNSPLFGRLESLDLSLGTLGDEGAALLLKALPDSKLKRLILDHHYMSEEMMEKFAGFGERVSLKGRKTLRWEGDFPRVAVQTAEFD